MKAESNRRISDGVKSKHIHIIYYLMRDVLKRGSIELIHYPTERMTADYFTKPLQGSLFRKMRDSIIGLVEFPDEERVELRENLSIDVSGEYKESVTKIHSCIKSTVGRTEGPYI